MTVTELKQMLAGIPSGTFTITAAQLGIADVTTLFNQYLGAAQLTLTGATGNPDTLTAQGQLSLGQQLTATAVFSSDGTNVTGVVITCTLPGWTWTSPDVAITATSAGTFLSGPQLLFEAGGTATAPTALVAGTIPITGNSGKSSFTMTAVIPAPSIVQGLEFVCQPNLTLNDLNALAQFATGANFNIVPQGVPVASSLTLEQVGFIVGPNIDAITSLALVVGSNEGLTIVPDVFVIESFTFTMVIPFPPSTAVYGSASTVLNLNGLEIELSAMFSDPAEEPDFTIEGLLVKPQPLKPFLSKFISVDAVPDSFTMETLMFSIGLTSPHPWVFEIELTNLWSIQLWEGQTFDFEQLLINASGQTGSTPTLLVYSAYSVAGTQLYLSAAESDGQWTFSGGTVGYQVINLIPLLSDLAKQFNLDGGTLPSSLTTFELTNIQLSYTTGNQEQEFQFSCAGQLGVSDVSIAASLSLDIKSATGANKFTVDFTGSLTLTVGATTVVFSTKIDVANGQTTVIGTLNSEDTPLALSDLLTALGFKATIPDGLNVTLKGLGVVYQTSTNGSILIVTAESNIGSAMFVADKQKTTTTYLFGANPAVSGSLADIPLIGSKIPPSLDVSLNAVQVLLASGALTGDQVTAINTLLGSLKPYLPQGNWQIASGPLNYTAEFSMTLSLAGDQLPLVLGVGSTQSPRALLGDSSSDAHYINVQKSVGPLFLNRIGFAYASGDIEFLLDASLTFSALSVSLTGLNVRTPLTSFQPQFGLDGLGLSMTAGPVSITGAFLSMTPNGLNDANWEYAGEIMIQAEGFGLAGLGAYGKFNGVTSLFLFVMLDAPLGGPAFFFVTGLAAGFGYNRNLTIPTLSDLPSFPLVAAAMSSSTGNNPFQGMTNNPGAALQVMEKYLGEAPGENWLAAGVRFTSFELLQSFALVTVSFGTRFELALLGLSAITVPTLDPNPVAYAELAVEVVFAPDDGLLAVSAQLTPASYVLSSSCHLTGGFAFYTWFKDDPTTGATAGDFVVTLGGYFPGYNVPKFYPSVPAIGANWQVDSSLSIKGGLYFALTPSAVMAGGYLSATWESGSLKAWFDADANFLLSWKPFHYQAEMSLTLGASWTLHLGFLSHTFTIHAGVDLTLWGPPFGGVAHVDLDIISFTISFGDSNPPVKAIPWTDFKSSFLPPQGGTTIAAPGAPVATNTYCLVKVSAGMRQDLTQTPNPQNLSWVIDPENFEFTTSSAIPITGASWVTGNGQTTSIDGSYPTNFGVGPVGVANGNLSSQHTITIQKLSGGAIDTSYVVDSSKCAVVQVNSAVPAAPWSRAMSLDLVSNPNISAVNSTPSTIAGLATGFTISANVGTSDTTPVPVALSLLADTPAQVEPKFSWSAQTIPSTDSFDQSTAMSKFMSTLASEQVGGVRSQILAVLVEQGVPVAGSVSVGKMATGASSVLLAAPVLSYLGEERAS